jgi:hypothetical protein
MESLITHLKQLTRKVEEVENKVNEIERGKLILEERKIIAKQRELEGRTYISNDEGGIVKEIRVPFCDQCGIQTGNFSICIECGRKLCENCAILYRKRILCLNCLTEILPLSKQEYKVLLAFANGLNDVGKIARITRVKEDLIEKCKKELENNGLILSRGILFFREIRISDKGLEAISAYRQVYGKEEDVEIFEYELGRILIEEG